MAEPSNSSSKMRHLRMLAFMICASAIVLLVVACQGPHADPFETKFIDTTGAIPERGLTVDDSVPLVNRHQVPATQGIDGATLAAQNANCIACHTNTDPSNAGFVDHGSMHRADLNVSISCVQCHGGHPEVAVKAGISPSDPNYQDIKNRSHVKPRLPDLWKEPGNPPIPGALTMQESDDYIRFVNPGDLRAAPAACGSCHNGASDADAAGNATQFAVNHVRTSMMAHGAMLWEAALYNNGAVPRKYGVYADIYDIHGTPASATANPLPSTTQRVEKGILSRLWPLARWEISQPGNILRVFERGGGPRPEIGSPDPLEINGNPDVKLSDRGFGTLLRTDPVFIGLQKSRLLDPTLNMFGTNDHAGDYRGSGCTGCHVVYANDRSKVHSGAYSHYQNRGQSFSIDPTVNQTLIPSTQPAHTTPYPDDYQQPPLTKNPIYPIKHVFVKSAPTSSCIVCHVHPGTNVVNAYLGFTWWDNETDGQLMYPKKQMYPTPDDEYRVSQSNPEGSAARGLWQDPKFLDQVGSKEFNAQLKHTQFADFHGHGWVFRAVFKQDRHGNLLDHDGNIVPDVNAAKMAEAVAYQTSPDQPQPKPGVPVHLKDIHLEMGMHCVDCHFRQDVHGDGNLYSETRAAVEVDCIDCHGTVQKPAAIKQYLVAAAEKPKGRGAKAKEDQARIDGEKTDALNHLFSGAAAATTLSDAEVSYRQNMIQAHFRLDGDNLVQIPSVDSDLAVAKPGDDGKKPGWVVRQTADTVVPPSGDTPEEKHAKLARFAHTIRRDGVSWGGATMPDESADDGKDPMQLAHGNSKMSCYACHSSWNTSCFGCHLPMRANQRKPMLHNEGLVTRNYTNYNYQTLRDDVYMLGIDSTVKGHKIVPIRSACAVMVSSQNAEREWIYHQQQTVSAEGFSGTAFSPYFPHTVRGAETKQCTDCHVSKAGDNNAIMAQVLMQGTHAVNFIGRYAWVGEGDAGLQAVAVTEHDEPQAVIGSRLHEIAYPDYFAQHQANGLKLKESYGHEGSVLDLQQRGEYVYAACGRNGFIAYDIAHIDDKNFSERIITAPVSPLGQQFYVPSKYATSICSPSTMALDPTKQHFPGNEEQQVSLLYAFLYMTDRYEGLIVIGNPLDAKKPGVSTLLDGDPENNYLQRALTYNPENVLAGARSMSLYGNYAYVCCDAGIKVLDMKDPLHPRLLETPGLAKLKNPKKIVFQFRYGFVIDDDGVKTVDITNPENPMLQSPFGRGLQSHYAIPDARDIVLCRTYAYVAAGAQGLVILNVEKPMDSYTWNPIVFNGDGALVDSTAVRVGMTNSSLFAYVADGVGGLKVVQLTSPDDTPGYLGFSPRPTPRLIATFPTEGPAIALGGGLDRDRAVDEAGNQLSVFGRRGARPFNFDEQRKLYIKVDPRTGRQWLYSVSNEPWNSPLDAAK